MARKPDPFLIDEDNPELTDEELAIARPACEAMPPAVYEGLTKRRPGERGPGRKPTKVSVTLRIDPDVIEAFKEGGAGWQRRMNEALRKAVGRG